MGATTFSEIVSKVGPNGEIRVTEDNWKVLTRNQDYSLVVYLTASPARIGCVLCQETLPRWEQVAYSYYQNLKSQGVPPPTSDAELQASNFVIAFSDFPEAKGFFEAAKLNNVPKIYYYPPGAAITPDEPEDQYRFSGSDSAQDFASWIMSHSAAAKPELFEIVTKTDYKSMGLTLFTIFGFTVFLYRHRAKVTKFLLNRRIWRAACMLFIILFTSGYMYNKIRGTAFTGKNKDGSAALFAPSQQSQYGAETQIISVIYAGLSVTIILLVDTVNKFQDPKTKFAIVFSAVVGTFVLYSSLMSAFEQKRTGYPYKFLHLF